jgi:hypothetical protein
VGSTEPFHREAGGAAQLIRALPNVRMAINNHGQWSKMKGIPAVADAPKRTRNANII